MFKEKIKWPPKKGVKLNNVVGRKRDQHSKNETKRNLREIAEVDPLENLHKTHFDRFVVLVDVVRKRSIKFLWSKKGEKKTVKRAIEKRQKKFFNCSEKEEKFKKKRKN